MISAIFKISVRNVLKHKTYSLIKVLGLALGFSAFILIGLFVQYELSWDKVNTKYDRIFRIQRHYSKTLYAMDGNDISPHTSAITAQLLEKQFPEFEKISVTRENGGKFLASVTDKQIYDEKGIYADSCFFDIFTYQFQEGTSKGALIEPFTIFLSRTMANKLFPNEIAIGKTVTLEKKLDFKVTGVYTDLLENSTMRPTYIISYSSLAQTEKLTLSNIGLCNCMTYALLKPGIDSKYLESKIKNILSGFNGFEYEELQLCPMKKLHLNPFGRNDYIIILMLYGLIGLFILLMSSFNYINLTTANAATRGKEVAVNKVNGSKRGMLIVQFLGETISISILALVLAFLLTKVFLPIFADIVDKNLSLNLIHDWKFIGTTILISLGVGLLSGIYPALFLSSLKIVSLFKGELFSKQRKKFSIKKALITFQFAISVFLILITLSFSMQIKYLTNKNLGFSKENMLYTRISVSRSGSNFGQLCSQILQHPEIVNASMSKHIPFVSFGGGMTNWEGGGVDEKISCRFNEVSYNFVKNMGISLMTGRDFSHNFPADLGKSCLINETAAQAFGWDNPIGKRINNNQLTIVGVLKNYVYKDLHNGIEPAILTLAPEEISGDWTFAFRINPANQKKARAILTSTFEKNFPNDPFEFHDLPSAFNNEYSFKIYHSINSTILFFTVFSIFLSIIGLFALVSFTVVRRTKEIGIRKINGSSSLGIFYLLSREYFVLLFFSLLIAYPTAWWVYEHIPSANKWHIQPWIFILGAVIISFIILITTSFQTIKAATRNPVESLRYE